MLRNPRLIELINLCGKACKYDPTLNIWHNERQLSRLLGSHVDYFLLAVHVTFTRMWL